MWECYQLKIKEEWRVVSTLLKWNLIIRCISVNYSSVNIYEHWEYPCKWNDICVLDSKLSWQRAEIKYRTIYWKRKKKQSSIAFAWHNLAQSCIFCWSLHHLTKEHKNHWFPQIEYNCTFVPILKVWKKLLISINSFDFKKYLPGIFKMNPSFCYKYR